MFNLKSQKVLVYAIALVWFIPGVFVVIFASTSGEIYGKFESM